MLVRTAEACGGFDWDDTAFEHVYADLEQSLYGTTRMYAAIAPLVGLSIGTRVELGPGLSVREATAEELGHELAPPRYGDGPERGCVIQLERELPADAGGAARRACGAGAPPSRRCGSRPALRVAGGPVVLERLDWHPFGDPADARDRRDRAGRRAGPARPVACEARRRAARADRGVGGATPS